MASGSASVGRRKARYDFGNATPPTHSHRYSDETRDLMPAKGTRIDRDVNANINEDDDSLDIEYKGCLHGHCRTLIYILVLVCLLLFGFLIGYFVRHNLVPEDCPVGKEVKDQERALEDCKRRTVPYLYIHPSQLDKLHNIACDSLSGEEIKRFPR
jgi:hypothetical protein